MNQKGIRTIAVAVLLIAALCVMATPASAKTYYTFDGHPAVQYYQSDMGYPLMKYIERVEYDRVYDKGNGYGVRLYLTSFGRELISSEQNHYVLYKVTDYVGTRPEWKTDRSYNSVATEILHHTQAGRQTVHIEYYYQDLKWWEKPFYGR